LSSESDEYKMSLEKGIELTELLEYRISTMTCIYDFHVELNEQMLYELADRILIKTKESYDQQRSNFKVIGVECFDKKIIGD